MTHKNLQENFSTALLNPRRIYYILLLRWDDGDGDGDVGIFVLVIYQIHL